MVPNLFGFLIREMEDAQAQVLSVTDLKALSMIEACAKDAGGGITPQCVAAAIAVIAPHAKVERVAESLGDEVAERFGKLAAVRDNLVALWVPHLCRIIRNDPDSALAFAAAALLKVVVERVRGAEGVTQVEECLRLALSTPHEQVKPMLQGIIDSLPAKIRQEEKKEAPSWVLSWSIDVSGSTDAKTRMSCVANTLERLHDLYWELYSQFLRWEGEFHTALLSDQRHLAGAPLDWRKLFVVKGIGDEIWLLYEVPKDNVEALKAAVARLIDASMMLLRRTIDVAITEHDDLGGDPEGQLDQRFDRVALPFKIFADVIEDGFEISRPRANFIRENVGSYLGRPNERLEAEGIQLANRLNGGHFEASGLTKLRYSYRTDYIGHDVDRFFRTTKGALAGVVTLGEKLFTRVGFESKPAAYPGLFKAHIMVQRSSVASHLFGDILYKWSDLAADQMKGLGYSYRVFHLSRKEDLFALHGGLSSEKDLYEPTRKVFTSEMVDSLRTLQQKVHEPGGESTEE